VTNSPVQSELSLLQLTVERAPDAIFWFDSDGKCQRVNDTACQWLGYSKEKLQTVTAYELFPHRQESGWSEHWNQIKEGKLGPFETHLRTKDDRSIPVELSCHYFEVGGDGYACAFARNLTERMHSKQALEKLQRHHELILNAAADGIFGLDLDGRHTFVNPAAASMLGYQVEELLGQPSHQTWHHTKLDGSPYPAEECNIYRAYKDGFIHRSDKEVFWRKDGTSFPVEYESTPIRDDFGTLVGAVVVFKDISERRRFEDAISKFRRHNDLILNAAGEGIFGLDLHGNHTFVNPAAARMLGYEPGELDGKPSHTTWHHTRTDGTPYPPEECPIYKAYKDGMVHEGDDEVFWRKDGTSFPAQYTSTPILDNDGNSVGAVVTFFDITEKKRMAAQLLEETKLAEVTRILGNIGHDIKNMLMPVLTGSSLLRDEINEHFDRLPSPIADTEERSKRDSMEIIDMIVNNSRRIQDQVREMADAVKGVTSPPRFAPCEVATVVEEVFGTLRVYAGEKGVILKTKGLESLPILEADERRLFNAFYNLINNAIPEMPAGGSVTVYGIIGEDGKTVKLSVADTGRGMPSEVRDSLFTQGAMSRKRGGTGLGTKIVKDVVDAHGGQITVESEEGVGTTFHMTLPIARPQ
jgi:PAS domain S-box-containing protein